MRGAFKRSVFTSRVDDVIVLRLSSCPPMEGRAPSRPPGSTTSSSGAADPADDTEVVPLMLHRSNTGRGTLAAEFSFAALPAVSEQEKRVVAGDAKASEQGVRDGLLYFRTEFAHENPFNPNAGYEGFGRVIARGGTRTERDGCI